MEDKIKETNFESESRFKFGIDSFTLKVVSVISMIIDHYATIYPMNFGGSIANIPSEVMSTHMILRMIGRLTFPIFAYLIVKGFLKTKNVKNYGKRMFIFAIIATPAYNIAFGQTFIYTQKFLISFVFGNVMWTFLFSIFLLCVLYCPSNSFCSCTLCVIWCIGSLVK